MTVDGDKAIAAIHEFWFGEIKDSFTVEDRNAFWYRGDQATDREIRERFGGLVAKAGRRELDHWKQTPRGRLVLILLLDQFTRNAYRGSARAFTHDTQAQSLCKEGLDQGDDQLLSLIERTFFYLPLEHSESLVDQNLCVSLFERLVDASPAAKKSFMQGKLDWAIKHRDIIERFGRFPRRNAALDRESTAEELAFLEQLGSKF